MTAVLSPNSSIPLGAKKARDSVDWDALRDNFLKWLDEEKAEPEHAEDGYQEGDHPRDADGKFSGSGTIRSKSGEAYEVSHHPNEPKRGYETYKVHHSGKQVGAAVSPTPEHGMVGHLPPYVGSVEIAPEHQRKGLGSELYKHIERHKGQPLSPSPGYQTPAGRALWESRKRATAQDGKLSHGDVGYQETASGHDRCAACRHFIVGGGTHCTKVVDPIMPKGWCKLFEPASSVASDSALRIALDKDSVRTFDKDGRLHVSVSNITKANVCPYRGDEIPGAEELGLEPDKIYNLYRAPDELQKAAPTLNGLPLLRKHIPVSADDHQPYDVVGAMGTDAVWADPYVRNSLTIWSADDIEDVRSGKKKELSAGYHYVPDMTAGEIDGKRFDGVMRDIVFNHVAIVEEGRAGPDVVVGDSAIKPRKERTKMKPTRLEYLLVTSAARAINPQLAMDKKVDYAPIFKGVTSKNLMQRKPTILQQMRAAVKGKTIAKDASVESLAHLLDQFEHAKDKHASLDESVSENQHKAMEAAAHGTSNLGIPKDVGEEFAEADKGKTFDAMAFGAKHGLSEDAIEELKNGLHGGALDEEAEEALDEDKEDEKEKAEDGDMDAEDEDKEDDEDKEKAEDADLDEEDKDKKKPFGGKDKKAKDGKAKDSKNAKDRKAMDKKVVTVDEMQAAIKAAVETERKGNQATMEARDLVRPYVGELSMALDSSEKVLRAAARALDIENADTIHASALPTLIKMRPRMGQDVYRREDQSPLLGQDSAVEGDDFSKRFPGADRIKAA